MNNQDNNNQVNLVNNQTDEQNTVVEQQPEINKKENKKKFFNTDERVIYEIKQEKESNPLIVLAFFAVLIGFMVSLPVTAPYLDKILGFAQNLTRRETNIVVNNTTEEDKNRIRKFTEPQVKGEIYGLEFSNFVTSYVNENYEINFTLKNTKNETYRFDKKIYLNLYYDSSLLYRALVFSYTPLASLSATEMNLIVNRNVYEKANGFKLEEITESMYPSVEKYSTDGDYKTIECKYNSNVMKYYFKENMLEKIDETYYITTEALNYATKRGTKVEMNEKYKTIEGITTDLVEGPTDFTLKNVFDLKTIQDKTLKDLEEYRYFAYHTPLETVHFESNAIGYTCD